VQSPPYFSAKILSPFRENSTTASAVTSCFFLFILCSRFREFLGSERIIASSAVVNDYCHQGINPIDQNSRRTETTVKLGILELSARLFDLIWIGASIAFVYFLYQALTLDVPWSYLGWLLGAGFISRQIADVLKDKRKRVDYVGQLIERGYEREDAESAWRIATGGGANLLRNLQQDELSAMRIRNGKSKPDNIDSS